MIVVADTSPLNYLILIEQIQVLEVLYHMSSFRLLFKLSFKAMKLRPCVRTWTSNPPAWLEVRSPVPTYCDSILLGAGESEAIALAEQIGAQRIMMDESLGRIEARSRHLEVIGTLGVLREAHQAGVLNLADAIERLKTTSFRVSPQILQAIFDSV